MKIILVADPIQIEFQHALLPEDHILFHSKPVAFRFRSQVRVTGIPPLFATVPGTIIDLGVIEKVKQDHPLVGFGEKIAKASLFLKVIKPEEIIEGSLDVTIPRRAFEEKALGKIEINLVYVSSPLKRETLTLSEKIE